jgi:hypothetical protein
MVLGVTIGVLLGVIGIVQAVLGGSAVLTLGWAIPAVYALLVIAATLLVARRDGVRSQLWFLVVLPCIHFCWGVGFVLGFLSLASNISALKNERSGGTSVGSVG